MKKNVSILIVFVMMFFSSVNAQWTQIGNDVDGEFAGDESAWGLSISGDGTTIVVGAPKNDGSGADAGHARVYKNIAGTWTQQGADINGETADDVSGESVSISDDGSIIAIGAIRNDGGGANSGHVRVYKNVSGVWVQQGSDINGEASSDFSGASVSLSGDGLTLAIGAIWNDGNGISSGHVRIYKFISGNWIQQGADINGNAGDVLGGAVSLSTDGLTVAIGATMNTASSTRVGYVQVYKFISGNWLQQGATLAGDATADLFGTAVSLSGDGLIVAASSPYNDDVTSNGGHVKVFKLISGNWVQQGADIGPEGGSSNNGYSLSLSENGLTLVTTAIFGGVNGGGIARVFKYDAGNWVQHGSTISSEMANDQLGRSVSMSSDGSVFAVGTPFNDGNGTSAGHVRVYAGPIGCTSGATNTIDTEISNVTFNTINQSSANNCTGYTNYTGVSTNVSVGQTYTLSITTGDCDGGTVYARGYNAYIDWNGDSDYSDAGELVFAQANTTTALSGSINITVPFTATSGTTTMRIVCTEGGVTGPCGSYNYGETEDYTLNIQTYCVSNATTTIDSKIDRVRLVGNTVTIDESTAGGTCETYTNNYSVPPADLTVNGTYTVEVTQGTCGNNYTRYCNVWIDYNKDGDFLDAGEMLSAATLSSGLTPFTYNINFTVPATAVSGNTAMRVIVKESGAATDPCAIYQWGETEDYLVNIQPACTLPVATTTGGNRCGTGTVSLSATPGAGGTGCKWYTVATGGTAIFTGTAYTTPSISANTTYYVSTFNATCETTTRTAVTAVVNTLPSVSFSNLNATYCNSANAVTLIGSPTGGTFSGNGITGNSFSPSAAGVGGHTITYTFTDGNGCTNSANNSTTVNASPTVSFSNLNATYCDNANAVTLIGSPAGGTFSGNGISGNIFTPSSAGAGGHTITYSYTAGNGCASSANNVTTINVAPAVSLSNLNAAYCDNANSVTLGGSPAGGTFTGNGMVGSVFSPAVAGAGGHTITYTFTDGNNCSSTTNSVTTINAAPVVSFTNLNNSYCDNANAVTLIGSPTGGTFTGSGITGNLFSPSGAGAGQHLITYTYTDGNSCTNLDTQSTNVNSVVLPVANFSFTTDTTSAIFTDLSTNAVSWNWNFGDGATDATQNPTHTYAQPGTYTVCLTVDNGCGGTDVYCDSLVNVTFTGVDELARNTLNVYPNPTKGLITIEIAERNITNVITVYDMLGKVIANKKPVSSKATIDLTGNERGVYFIKVQNNKGTIVRKIVLQ